MKTVPFLKIAAILLCAGVWMFPRMDAATATLGPVNLTGGDYVIASDADNPGPGYVRNTIPVSVAVSFSGTSSEPVRQYRVRFRLFEETTGEILGSFNTPSTPWPVFFSGGSPQPPNLGFTGNITPTAPLDHQRRYRVEAQLQIQTTLNGFPFWVNHGAAPSFSEFRRFYHFTSTVSTDVEFNVLARTTGSASYTRRFLIDGSPTQDHAIVSVPYELRRYDSFAAVTAPVNNIEVRWEVRLFNTQSGSPVEVPLLPDPSWNYTVAMAGFIAGTTKTPVVFTATQPIRIRPAQQIDSWRSHYVVATLSHVERPAIGPGIPAEVVTADTRQTSSLRILHFNGRLDFGPIQTTLLSVENNPVTGNSLSGTEVNCSLQIDEAHLTGAKSGHTLTPGQTFPVRLLPDGRAVFNGMDPVNVLPPQSPDRDTILGIDYLRASIRLSQSGASSGVFLMPPSGMTITNHPGDKLGMTFVPFIGIALTQELRPIVNRLTFNTPSGPLYVAEETKPVQIQCLSITWEIDLGRIDLEATGNAHHTQEKAWADLEVAPVPSAQKIKRSNDGYYRQITGLVTNAAHLTPHPTNQSARLTTAFAFGSGTFRTHFPYDAIITMSGGQMVVENDVIDLDPNKSRLDGVGAINVVYLQSCPPDPENGCASSPFSAGNFTLTPVGNRLLFTPDGGLIARGNLPTVPILTPSTDPINRLMWGFINDPSPITPAFTKRFAHSTPTRFTGGTFHASGHFLGIATGIPSLGPGIVHLSGFSADNPAAPPERPGIFSLNYHQGLQDYAGINLRVSEHSGVARGLSIIGDQLSSSYLLKDRSKYYVRYSGVSGIHDAAEPPANLVLYGFPVSFSNLSLAFISSENTRSATVGTISVPYPSDFIQSFEEMRLTCLGDLKEAKIPDSGEIQTLAYWDAEFKPYTLEIEKEDGCYPGGNAILVMAIETNMHHVPTPLYGTVGWFPNGNIVPANSTYSVTSRFPLPSLLTLAGPGNERYSINPVSEAYFNDYATANTDSGAAPPPRGFISFAARMTVPFFEKLDVHIHTFARPFEPPAGSAVARLHLMGGWVADNTTFFKSTDFDLAHHGFPTDLPGSTNNRLLRYRNEAPHRLPDPPTNPGADNYRDYRVYARRAVANIIDFEYPIEFISGARVWTSPVPQVNDLLVFSVGHQIDRMSAEWVDITFGMKLDGLPSASLSNTSFSFVDEVLDGAPAGGLQHVINQVIDGPVVTEGLQRLGRITGDRIDPLLERYREVVIQPILAQAYDDLRADYLAGSPNPGGPLAILENDLFNSLSDAATANLAGSSSTSPLPLPANASLLTALRIEVYNTLGAAILALDQFSGNQAGALFNPGPLQNYPNTAAFAMALMVVGSPQTGASVASLLGPALDAQVNNLMQRHGPSLATSRESLLESRALLVALQDSVRTSNGQLTQKLRKIIVDANPPLPQPSEAGNIADGVRIRAQQIAANPTQAQQHFTQFNRSVFEEKLMERFVVRTRASPFTAQVLGALRQYLYDTDDSLRGNIDSGFRVANRITRDLLIQVMERSEPKWTNALGELAGNGALQVSAIDGYARMQNDTLRSLRLDMNARLSLMTDLSADMYLQIDTRQSDGKSACSWGAAGSYMIEVRLGADNIEASWLGEMRLNVGMKFTFHETDGLLGMGGAVELAGGKANFERFGITDFGATAMFGALENYVGARARAEFNRKAIRVGFFFGRTCSIDPLKLVDKDVAAILGSPPFTGGYIYGEMSYPLNEILGIPASCFLAITGTVGSGIWVFIENPEFGAKLYFKIQGEVLCVFDIGGEITLLGGKSGSKFVLSGRGRLWVEFCFFFCFEGSATVRVKCINDDCDFDVDV